MAETHANALIQETCPGTFGHTAQGKATFPRIPKFYCWKCVVDAIRSAEREATEPLHSALKRVLDAERALANDPHDMRSQERYALAVAQARSVLNSVE